MPTHRVLIEFVVDVPNDGVARDVETRLTAEHGNRLFDILTSMMGHEPIRAPGKQGMFVSTEPVQWNGKHNEWLGEGESPDDE